jgi:iron complex outermembrane receptor protein
MDGFDGNPDLFITRKFQFLNPKAGISYFHNGWHGYLSYALAHKEPNRDDFQAGLAQQPQQETLHDFESGISKKSRKLRFSGTLYYMLYKNQLVLTGKLNDVGNYTRVNVPNSYRLGMELEGEAIVNTWMRASVNFSFSKNKIKDFTEYLDDYDNGGQVAVNHHNTDISFSPSLIGGATFSFYPARNLVLSAVSKYVGRQYMDNTQNNARSLRGFYTEDLRSILTVPHLLFHEWEIILQVNNLFNKLYEPNGSTYPYISGGTLVNDNYYYPMAGTNYMIALNVNL